MIRKVRYLLALLALFFQVGAEAQQLAPSPKNGNFYFYWGYNRSQYSKTNLHFNGPNYDFTLYRLSAKDRPKKIGWSYLSPTTFTIPQYNARAGYFMSDRFVISVGIDHMKYVIIENQPTTISGVITETASSKYAGFYLNEVLTLKKDLLEFEHTDGFNLVSLEVEYLYPIYLEPARKISIYWNMGLGGIWIVTKTNVKVFGDGLDNDFHVAGFTLAGKAGPRIEYKGKYFFLGEVKGGYASIPSVLIKNSEPEIGDHTLNFLEYYLAIGVNFKIGKHRSQKRK